MYCKVIAIDTTAAEKVNFLNLAKTAVAGAGVFYSGFIFTLPLLLHYKPPVSLDKIVSTVQDDFGFGGMINTAQTLLNFKTHSAGTLGLAHTVALTLLSFYGFGLVKDAVQKLRLPRFTLAELQTKFPEFNNINQKLFALQTEVQDQDLLEQVFALLKRQGVIAPLDTDRYTVNVQNCTEEIRAALFDLGLTIGQTDAAMFYLRNAAERNAELFFKHTLFGARKLVARATLLPRNEQRRLARSVFQEQLTPEREEAFLKSLRIARHRTVSIDTQIALSIILPLSVSIYNFISGDYIPCCPLHYTFIEDSLGGPWQNYAGALPGLAEAAFLAVMHGHLSHVIEELAENKTRKALAEVMSTSQLDEEYLTLQNGRQISTPLENITPRSILTLKKGQMLPVDAVALQQVTVSEAHMTGEPVPVLKMPGQTVLAGAIIMDDTAQAQALRTYADSALVQLEKRIQQAVANKSGAENIVEKFSSWWSPLASVASLGYFIYGVKSGSLLAIKNALTLLVATTPCALQTALPVGKLSATFRLAKDGVVLPGFKFLSAAAKTNIVVFDKTDTLTDSSCLSIHGPHRLVADNSLEQDLSLLYGLEVLANHPIADEIRKHIGPQERWTEIKNFQDLGKAVQGMYTASGQEHTVSVGSLKYLRDEGLLSAAETDGLSEDAVVMAVDGQARLYFEYTETLRADAVDTIIALQKTGRRVVIASGDSRQRVQAAVDLLNEGLLARGAEPLPDIDVYAEQRRPEEKEALVRSLQKDSNGVKQYVTMVGDGNNDSAALAAADFGISWSARGLARAAADAIVTDGSHLSKIVDILQMARRYSHNMIQNISLSTILNALIIGGVITGKTGLMLNAAGSMINENVGLTLLSLDMFISLIAHEGLTVGAALNAARLGKKRKVEEKIKALNRADSEKP
jgi:cation transport ATPase